MRIAFSCVLITIAGACFGQIGRHEQPIDTISIGGKQQERMMTHLEGYEQLLEDLKLLRDSVTNHQHAENTGTKDFTTHKEKLNKLIAEMEEKDRDEALMREGYIILKEVRRDVNQAKAFPSDK
jgi:hypothetical protein